MTVVRAEDGSPIADALVRLWLGETGVASVAARTDAAGFVRLTIDPGQSTVAYLSAAARGRQSVSQWPHPPYPPIAIAPGSRVDMTMALQSRRTVVGRILDDRGAGIAGVRIGIGETYDDGSFRADNRRTRSAERDPVVTDASGQFESLASFYPPTNGNSVFSATHDEFVPGYFFGLETIPEAADGAVHLELRLARGRTLAGRVVDGSGAGVPGARMTARPERPRFSWDDQRAFETDATGAFRIGGLPLADAAVSVDALGFERKDVGIDLRHGDMLDLAVELTPGSIVEGVTLDGAGKPMSDQSVHLVVEPSSHHLMARTDASGRFRIRGAPSTGSARLSWSSHCERQIELPTGPVELRESQPIEVRIAAISAEDGAPLSAPNHEPQRPTGYWHVAGLSASLHLDPMTGLCVERLRPGRVTLWVDMEGTLATKHTFDLPETGLAEPVVIRVARGLAIEGRVADGAGHPFRSVAVHYRGHDNSYDVRFSITDDDGRYRLSGLRPDGYLQFFVRGFAPSVVPVARCPDRGDGALTHDVVLDAGVTYHGEVRRADGSPVGGVVVDPLPPPPHEIFAAPLASALVGADGTYRLERMPARPMRLAIGNVMQDVDGKSGDVIRVDFTLP